MTVYEQHGYKNRGEYLASLCEEYDADIQAVTALADMLGPLEDFDGLVVAVMDMSAQWD